MVNKMPSRLLMNFVVDKDSNAIQVKREFATPLPLVWDAFTKSEILDQWWAPKPWKTKTKSMDFREGGVWLYAMVGPEGEEHWSFAKYLSIQNQKNFTLEDGFCDANGEVNNELPKSNWNTKFNKIEKGTLVEILISYDDLAQLEAIIQMGFKEGLTIAMEGLDELLHLFQRGEI